MYRHGPSCRGAFPARPRVRWKKSRPAMTLRKMQQNTPAAADDPPIRTELVRRVRQAIADGVYETPEKWLGALERLMDRAL